MSCVMIVGMAIVNTASGIGASSKIHVRFLFFSMLMCFPYRQIISSVLS